MAILPKKTKQKSIDNIRATKETTATRTSPNKRFIELYNGCAIINLYTFISHLLQNLTTWNENVMSILQNEGLNGYIFLFSLGIDTGSLNFLGYFSLLLYIKPKFLR